MRINQHIKEVHKLPEDWEKVARHSEPQFSKGKDDVWNDMVAEIDGKTQDPKVIQLRWFKYAAAAAIVLLLSITAFLRFYTETVSVPAGLHRSVSLPDGSSVELNAATELSFHPFWWQFDRSIKMEGEAFFDVKKGSSFSVISKNGITTVLGTSFNINSREESYIVFCKTGKVSVELEASKVVIMSNESAQLKANGELEKRTGVNGSEFIGWVDDQFIFNARPLRYVTKEIELQYNIDLNILEDDVADWKFTGAFNRSDDVNVTLEVISISMGIKFEQNSDGSYSLMKQNH
jgi:ferric-dicitrate binding protein FerR (iron transport regulator)